MVLLFIGPSGSGKDTQAEFLVNDFGYKRISTGDLIRELVEGENTTQLRIRSALKKGFTPNSFVTGLMEMYMSEEDSQDIVFSGSVRRFEQVKLFDDVLALTNRKIDKVIYFDLSDEEATKRMTSRYRCPTCQRNYNLLSNPPKSPMICDIDRTQLTRREDDTEEGMKARLAEFHVDNDKIVKEYESKGILIKLDASKGIEQVHNDLIKSLGMTK